MVTYTFCLYYHTTHTARCSAVALRYTCTRTLCACLGSGTWHARTARGCARTRYCGTSRVCWRAASAATRISPCTCACLPLPPTTPACALHRHTCHMPAACLPSHRTTTTACLLPTRCPTHLHLLLQARCARAATCAPPSPHAHTAAATRACAPAACVPPCLLPLPSQPPFKAYAAPFPFFACGSAALRCRAHRLPPLP